MNAVCQYENYCAYDFLYRDGMSGRFIDDVVRRRNSNFEGRRRGSTLEIKVFDDRRRGSTLEIKVFDDRRRGSSQEIEFRRSTTRFDAGNRISKVDDVVRRRNSNFEGRRRGSTLEIKVFDDRRRGSTPEIEFRRSTTLFDAETRISKVDDEVRP